MEAACTDGRSPAGTVPAADGAHPPVIDAAVDAGGGPPPRMDAATPRDAVDAPPPAPPMAPLPLPTPWRVDNIGKDVSKDSAVYLMNPNATYFILRTSSLDVVGTEDSFQFLSQPIKGDGEIIGKVRNVDFTAPTAKAGFMVRASADPKAENIFLVVGAGGIGHVQARATAGGGTMKDDTDKANLKVGTYLRITRVGNTFTAYRGDRKTWTKVGSFEIKMPAEALFGLAASASNLELLGQFEFDSVRVNNFISDKSLDGWYHEDFGLVGGAVLFEGGAGGTLTAKTFGYPWSTTQEFFTFTFREIMGNFAIKFRVRSIEETDPNARVAAMFRASNVTTVSRSHAHAAVSVTLGRGAEFQHRTANGGNRVISTATADAAAKPPLWLRLERVGNKFTGQASPDGKDGNWKELGSAEFTMEPAMSIGIAVNAHTNTKVGGAVIDNISVGPVGP